MGYNFKGFLDKLCVNDKILLINFLKQKYAKNFKLALALGGGGSKTFPQVEIMCQLEQIGIKPDILSGTSQGAANALRYVIDGCSAEKLKEWVLKSAREDWYSVSFAMGKYRGVITNENLGNNLAKGTIYEDKKVSDLPVKVYVTWTNAQTLETYLANDELICDAVKGSTRVPKIMPPLNVRGQNYVDGGTAKNVPFDVFKDGEADFVLAIDVIPHLPTTPFAFANIWNKHSFKINRKRKELLKSKYDLYWDVDTANTQYNFSTTAKKKCFREGKEFFEQHLKELVDLLTEKMVDFLPTETAVIALTEFKEKTLDALKFDSLQTEADLVE